MKQNGFTLIEALVLLAIILILGSIAVSAIKGTYKIKRCQLCEEDGTTYRN